MTTASAAPTAAAAEPLGIIALNLGGPGSLDDVQPFLRRLFGDPDVIQLGLARPLQPLLAWAIARSRGPVSRAAYAQIGGKSPILDETTAQAKAVAAEVERRGVRAVPAVAMAAWHPLAEEALAALAAAGVRRAVAVPLYPHESRATTGSSLGQLERARRRAGGIEIARLPTLPRRRRLPSRSDRAHRRRGGRPSPRAPGARRRWSSPPTACPRRTSAGAIPTSTTCAPPSRP